MAGNEGNGSTHTHTSLVALLMLGGVQSALAGQCASTAARDTRVGPRLDRQGTQLPHPCYHSNTLHNLFHRSSSLFQLSNECVHYNLYPSLCMFEAGSKSLPCFQQSKPTLPASLGYCSVTEVKSARIVGLPMLFILFFSSKVQVFEAIGLSQSNS